MQDLTPNLESADYKIELDEGSTSAKVRVIRGFTDYGNEIGTKTNRETSKNKVFDDVYKVVAKQVGNRWQFADPVTNETLDKPLQAKIFSYLLQTPDGEVMYLTIPKDSGRAILVETVVYGQSSWTESRFGTCQQR